MNQSKEEWEKQVKVRLEELKKESKSFFRGSFKKSDKIMKELQNLYENIPN